MYEKVDKPKIEKSRVVVNSVTHNQSFKFVDNRQQVIMQKKISELENRKDKGVYINKTKQKRNIEREVPMYFQFKKRQLLTSNKPNSENIKTAQIQPGIIQGMFSQDQLKNFQENFPDLVLMKSTKKLATVSNGPKNNPEWETAIASYSKGFGKVNGKVEFIGLASAEAAKVGNYIKKNIDRGGKDDTKEKITVTYSAMCGKGPCALTYQFGGRFGDGYVIDMIGFSDHMYISTGLRQDKGGDKSYWENLFSQEKVPVDVKDFTSFNATHEQNVANYDLEHHDDITKMAGESARWIAVRDALKASCLNDNTFFYFYDSRIKSDKKYIGIYFDDLWVQWQNFKKKGYYFDIGNSTLIEFIGKFYLNNTKEFNQKDLPKVNWKLGGM